MDNPEEMRRWVQTGRDIPCGVFDGGVAIRFKPDTAYGICARDGNGFGPYWGTGILRIEEYDDTGEAV